MICKSLSYFPFQCEIINFCHIFYAWWKFLSLSEHSIRLPSNKEGWKYEYEKLSENSGEGNADKRPKVSE